MKNVKIEMTQQELVLAITLMSDQLFRREFIDPKMPGLQRGPYGVGDGQGPGSPLNVRDSASGGLAGPIGIEAPSQPSSFNTNGIRDAV